MAFGLNAPFGLRIQQNVSGGGLTDKMTPYKVYVTPANNTGPSLANSAGYLFKGDPVVFSTTAGAAMGVSAGTIAPMFGTLNGGRAATALAQNSFVGIFMGCEYTEAATGLTKYDTFIPNGLIVKPGTNITAYVNDDPNVLFEVQYSTATDNVANEAIFLNTFIGQNAKLQLGGVNFAAPVANIPAFNPASGSVATKTSGVYLNGASITLTQGDAGNPAFDVKIISVADYSGNITVGATVGVDVPFVNVLCKFNRHAFGSTGTPAPYNLA